MNLCENHLWQQSPSLNGSPTVLHSTTAGIITCALWLYLAQGSLDDYVTVLYGHPCQIKMLPTLVMISFPLRPYLTLRCTQARIHVFFFSFLQKQLH